PGSLTYGELPIAGRTRDEVLFFTHVCHPSLANDNTSGMAVMTALAEWIAREPRRFTYRFVFAPGTIGSLSWLKRNESRLSGARRQRTGRARICHALGVEPVRRRALAARHRTALRTAVRGAAGSGARARSRAAARLRAGKSGPCRQGRRAAHGCRQGRAGELMKVVL